MEITTRKLNGQGGWWATVLEEAPEGMMRRIRRAQMRYGAPPDYSGADTPEARAASWVAHLGTLPADVRADIDETVRRESVLGRVREWCWDKSPLTAEGYAQVPARYVDWLLDELEKLDRELSPPPDRKTKNA